ncbi:MAG: cobalt ECF transporter T component CbiQ [Magnetococcales bacterium]|nr:cobalt ECF transporter T component CbiQ [Magnetococcales bacterium]
MWLCHSPNEQSQARTVFSYTTVGKRLRVKGVDGRVRIIAAVLFAVVTTACSRLDILTAIMFSAVLLAWFARLPVVETIKKLLSMDGFILILIATLPFTTTGTHWFGFSGFTASVEGGQLAMEIFLTANACMLSFLALVAAMPHPAIASGLRGLGCSKNLIQILLLTIRYIETLRLEYQRLRTAMQARGFQPRNNLHTWRSYGYLAGMLIVRSLDRADRVLAAMKCRGFRGSFPTVAEDAKLTKADYVFLWWFFLAVLFVVVWQWG